MLLVGMFLRISIHIELMRRSTSVLQRGGESADDQTHSTKKDLVIEKDAFWEGL